MIDFDKHLTNLNRALIIGDRKKLSGLLKQIEPDRLTDYLNSLSSSKLARFIHIVALDELAELLSHLSPQTSAELLAKVSHEQSADVLEEMEPDEAADVVEEFSLTRKHRVLGEMRQPERAEIQKLLTHKKDTAGTIMTPRSVVVSNQTTVEQALAVVRTLADKPEYIYYLYVLNEKDKLVGVLSLRNLLLAKFGTRVEEIMEKKVITVQVNEDQEIAAKKVLDNDFSALPVVDKHQKLLGIITYDDASDVLEEEASEDITRIGGAQPLDRPYMETSLLTLTKKRVGWLFVLFAAQTITGNVLSVFSGTLSQVVALSFFIPLLIGTGGNVGSQTVTLVVRALAVGQADLDDLLAIIWKEARTGIVLGAILGTVGFFWAQFFTGEAQIGLTVGLTILIISLFAATVGALIPLLLHRLKFDPATASTPFISTVVDASGLVIYFLIARTLLAID